MPDAVRARHHVEVVRRVAVRHDHRVVAARHHDDVVILDGHRLVERAIVGVDALEREALRRIEPVIVRFLERALGGHRVGVVLVRRIARRMAGRRDHLDDQQRLGGLVLRQDVADVARVRALPAHRAPHRRRLDQPRRHALRAGAVHSAISASVCAGDAHVASGRQIDGVRRDVLERARAPADFAPCEIAALHRHAARDDDDAQLAPAGRGRIRTRPARATAPRSRRSASRRTPA